MKKEMVRMIELAQQGFYCSQILLILGLDLLGKRNPDLIKVMSGLAGGLGFSGDVCGALTGGACFLGLFAGRGTVDEEEDYRLNLMVGELVDWFSKEHGTMYGGNKCDAILGDDPNSQKTKCPKLVFGVYDKVYSLLIQYGFDISGEKHES